MESKVRVKKAIYIALIKLQCFLNFLQLHNYECKKKRGHLHVRPFSSPDGGQSLQKPDCPTEIRTYGHPRSMSTLLNLFCLIISQV